MTLLIQNDVTLEHLWLDVKVNGRLSRIKPYDLLQELHSVLYLYTW